MEKQRTMVLLSELVTALSKGEAPVEVAEEFLSGQDLAGCSKAQYLHHVQENIYAFIGTLITAVWIEEDEQ